MVVVSGCALFTPKFERPNLAVTNIQMLEGNFFSQTFLVTLKIQNPNDRALPVNGLAADLQRHLDNEPVTARPPSAIYRFQKAFRRNRIAFVAATAIVATLLLGIVASTWQSVRATRAMQQAQSAEAHATEQRERAQVSEKNALAAQSSERKLRQQAEGAELAARQRAYASDMNVARQALTENNLGRALDLLNRQRPAPGQKDLRGWEWRYLWKQTRSDAAFTLYQEPAGITSLTASPDGRWLAVGSHHKDGLAVWDLQMRQELFRLATNEANVRAAFSTTEPLLAITGMAFSVDGQSRVQLRLWNLALKRMVAELPLDNDCLGLAFAQDGRTLVTSTAEGHITLWQVPSGAKLASYPSEQSGGSQNRGFATTPDLGIAAFAMSEGRIRAIDLHSGKELWTVRAAKEFVTALAFSPDGRTLASAAGYTESNIRLWKVDTGKQITQLDGHGSWVGGLVFWPDGKKLASGSADQTIRTWDLAGQKCLDVLRGHRLEVWRVALLPDGKTLVSGGKDGTICIWDTSLTHDHPPRNTLPERNIVNANFSTDGQSILTLDQQGELVQWAGADFRIATPVLKLGENVFSSCFSEDGRYLAAHWTNGTVQVWDLAQRILRHQFTTAPGIVWSRTSGPEMFVPGGRKLITWSAHDGLLHLWDLPSGVEEQSWLAPASGNSFALSPDGRQCVAYGWGGDFMLRNLIDRSQRRLNLDTLEPDVAIYSPDGTLFAVASSLGFGRVWNTATWQPVATLGGFLKGAHTLAFSADGRRVAVGGGDQEAVKLWDTESWQDLFTLEGQGTGYMGVWFSSDGNSIAWGNQSGVLHVWHAPSWEEIAAVEARENSVIPRP